MSSGDMRSVPDDNAPGLLKAPSRLLQQFRPVLWGQRLHVRSERGLCCFVELGRRCGASRDRNADFQKEVFLAGW